MTLSKINFTQKNSIFISKDGKLTVPNNPVIPFIEGDGVGSEVTSSMIKIVNYAVEKSYGKKRFIDWM